MKTKLCIVLVLVVILLMAGCSMTDESDKVEGTIEEIATSFITDLENQDTDRLLKNYNYSSEMQQALSENAWNQIYADMNAKFGTWVQTNDYKIVEQVGYQIVAYDVKLSQSSITLNIVFGTDNVIAGLNYLPMQASLEMPEGAKEIELTIGTDEFPLGATLTLPPGDGPFPVVVLVHGSGPSDRNETVGENRPFEDIAIGLVKQDIGSLRYDKRTFVHANKIDGTTFTVYEESIEDTKLAFEQLLATEKIDPNNIFIAGHSLGGYLMPMIAKHIPDAAGYIIISGPVTPLEDLMLTQFEYIFNVDGLVSAEEQAQLTALRSMRDSIKSLTANTELASGNLMGAGKAYWLYLQDYVPNIEAKSISKPLLIMQGSRDYQVTVDEFNLWQAELAGMSNATFKLYEGVNHLLYQGEGASTPNEYLIPGHVEEAIVTDIINWIKDNKK